MKLVYALQFAIMSSLMRLLPIGKTTPDLVTSDYVIPGLQNRPNFHYFREGDINLAHFTSARQASNTTPCSDPYINGVIRVEALKFAIDKINNRSDILPNITLGFLSLDDCWDGQKALEVAVYLVQNVMREPNDTDNSCPANDAVGDVIPNKTVVVGALGPSNSPMSVSVAPFLGVFHIPVMAIYATSDDLSDKTRYEYFLRLVPPDNFQERTILEIARRLGWTYLAMVYTEGAYGENAASQIDRFLRNGDYNICVSVSVRIPTDANQNDYRNAVRRLQENPNSRVVLTFLQGFQQETFFATIKAMAGLGTYLFLSGDTLQNGEGEVYADVLEGSIYTDMPAYPIPGFMEYVSRLTPWTDPDDFWLAYYWEKTLGCKLSNSSIDYPKCNFTSEGILDNTAWAWSLPSRDYDGVFVYAETIDLLIRNECPMAFQDTSLLEDCLDGATILAYLKNSSTNGVIGNIRFNSNGDMIGDILILQYQRDPVKPDAYTYVEVGNWTTTTNSIILDSAKFNWSAFHRNDSEEGLLQSVCSKPCQVDEYAIRQDMSCCWLCFKCRDNEIVNQNATGCQPCPLYNWPDRSNASAVSTCNPIPPTYLRPENPISVTLLLLAIIGTLTSMSVAVVYHVKRDHRLVKATSRELSLLILFGTVLASIAVVFFIVIPSDGTCICRNVGFHVAINFLYGPLLVKNIRTYRIFRAGQKSVKIPAGVGRNTQLIYVAAITGIQMIIISISEAVDTSVAMLKMPTTYEMYVEIYCRKSVLWFLVPLASNISLMVLCAALGYATRKLPENFNESGFIFVSVATTLFAWLVFIPAYFSAVYAHLQSAILGFCLVLNAYVTLGCQFIRIVYAVYFVAPERISFNTTMSYGASTTLGKVGARVAPTETNVTKIAVSPNNSAPVQSGPYACTPSDEVERNADDRETF